MKEYYKTIMMVALINAISFLDANALSNVLKVKIINGSNADETVIRFLPNATTGFDASYDAYKILSTNSQAPAVYTEIDPASRLSINALPLLTSQVSIVLYMHVKAAGTYIIQSIESGAFDTNFKIQLEDKATGTTYEFRNGSSIAITMDANTLQTADRFIVHFIPVVDISTGMHSNQVMDPVSVTLRDNAIHLNIETTFPLNVTICIYNTAGQKLYHYSSGQLYNFTEDILLPSTGNYIVCAVVNDTIQIQKICYLK